MRTACTMGRPAGVAAPRWQTAPVLRGFAPRCVLYVCALALLALAGCSTVSVSRGNTTASSSTDTSAATDTPAASASDGSTRQVSNFHTVALNGVGELTITQTGSESLRIEAEAKVLPLLTSTVSGGRLTLGVKSGASIQTSEPTRYTLTVKSLDDLELAGAGTVTASGLDTSALAVTLTGTGSVTLRGTAQTLRLALSGTGSFDGSALSAKTATVSVGGTGKAVVNASDTLDATVSGVGSVEYLGNPQVTSHITGLGSVRQR